MIWFYIALIALLFLASYLDRRLGKKAEIKSAVIDLASSGMAVKSLQPEKGVSNMISKETLDGRAHLAVLKTEGEKFMMTVKNASAALQATGNASTVSLANELQTGVKSFNEMITQQLGAINDVIAQNNK